MRVVKAVLLVGALVVVCGLCASAATIPIPNTGGSGWTISGTYTGPAETTLGSGTSEFPFDMYWTPDDATSSWISPQASYTGGQTDAPGLYNFNVVFDLTGFDPTTALLVFNTGFDDQLNDVLLNGSSVGFGGLPNTNLWVFPALTGLTINSGFQAGNNTLTFVVENSAGLAGNPVGLRVAFTTATVDPLPEVPEPATFVLMGSALIGLGFMGRRRFRRKG